MKTKILAAILLTLALAIPALAQGPPGGPGPEGPPPWAVLREVLGLSEEQMTALHGLMEARQQAIQAIIPQLEAAEAALREAVNAPNPDPAQIGTLLLTVHGLRGQIEQANQAYRTGFWNLLTTAQQAKVQEVLALEKSLMGAHALHQLDLASPGGPGGVATDRPMRLPHPPAPAAR